MANAEIRRGTVTQGDADGGHDPKRPPAYAAGFHQRPRDFGDRYQKFASSGSTNFNGNEAPGPGLISATKISLAQAEAAGFQNLVTGYNLEVRTVVTINAMRELSRLLAGLPGRKNIIWVTSDFPFDLIPQDANMSDAEMITERHGGGV